MLSLLSKQKDANMIRKIDDNSSVRNGKYGPYIFYKTNLNETKIYKIKKYLNKIMKHAQI